MHRRAITVERIGRGRSSRRLAIVIRLVRRSGGSERRRSASLRDGLSSTHAFAWELRSGCPVRPAIQHDPEHATGDASAVTAPKEVMLVELRNEVVELPRRHRASRDDNPAPSGVGRWVERQDDHPAFDPGAAQVGPASVDLRPIGPTLDAVTVNRQSDLPADQPDGSGDYHQAHGHHGESQDERGESPRNVHGSVRCLSRVEHRAQEDDRQAHDERRGPRRHVQSVQVGEPERVGERDGAIPPGHIPPAASTSA